MPSPINLPAPPSKPEDLIPWAESLISILGTDLDAIRESLEIQGTPVSSRLLPQAGAELDATGADIVLAGFGATGSVALAVGSTDARGRFTVTAAGAAPANPATATLTFRDGAWPQAPFAIVAMNGGTGVQAAPTWVLTTTTLVITYPALPVAGQTYTFEYLVLG